MADVTVGWLVPTSLNADGTLPSNMQIFQTQLQNQHHPHGNVTFPNPQFLNGDNAKLASCVQTLMAGNYNAFAVGGSSGVRALAEAQAGQMPKIPICQVVGGDPVPENSTYITGYHIDAANVATAQVAKLNQKVQNLSKITVLLDYSSDTSARVYNAVLVAANNSNPPISVTPLFARNPTELLQLSYSSVQGSFMLGPSGMFYNPNNIDTIKTLVEAANVPAVYPEREFKNAHTPQYRNKVWVVGHNIPATYSKAAKLACDLLLNIVDPGAEAPDKDIDP